MTPQEKSKELFDKYYDYLGMPDCFAKECALIAVDEILEVNKYSHNTLLNYWQEVKQEIEKL